ncbi:unnamed protein product [Orchesella dallaii]|uniref:SAP domain-containing protein n=1 Tax=Orchesella dallaii TaxID=48710 RepID=A0ABP1S1I0_9HEXA
MNSSVSREKEGEGGCHNETTLGLHDHSDLLIPNTSFAATSSSSSASPSSNHDLQKEMDCQMTSPQPIACDTGQQHMSNMEYIVSQPTQSNSSPPNVIVDDSPLQPCINRNKESLKVKLLMRRPMNQLVEQGILPPPKTPAAFAGQRVRLERARMGDFLKAKIQQRPARQELIRQHILEDSDSRVAPSLAEKQRMLKRARLADSLNDHLIHRPGPLELVQKNILHAPDADIEQAIKDGIVSFKATSEGHVPGPNLPSKYTCNEDDSSSDISSPAGTPDAPSSCPTTEAGTPISKQPSDPAITPSSEPCEVTLLPAKTNKSETTQFIITSTPSIPQATPSPTTTTIFQVTPAAQSKTTVAATVIPPPPPLPPGGLLNPPQTIVLSDGAVRELLPQLQSAGFQLATHVQNAASIVSAKPTLVSQSSSSSSLGKSRSSKKSSKSKSQPKTRTIKFHEYKGPSNCQQKGGYPGSSSSALAASTAASKAESSYELLLKQQQLFLQWQLEWQHKYPQILLPAAPKVSLPNGSKTSIAATTLMSTYPVTTIPASLCANLINNHTSSQPIAVTTSIATSPKPIAVTLVPKISTAVEVTPVQQVPISTVASIIAAKPSPQSAEQSKSEGQTLPPSPSSSDSGKGDKSVKQISLNTISEWKVSDLKAELKKRSLPVSGSKMQLVERLKTALQQSNASPVKEKSVTKMEMSDENSNETMMDVSSNDDQSKTKVTAPTSPAAVVIGPSTENNNVGINNNISILDLANGKLNGVPISLGNILDLLGLSSNNANENSGAINNNSADVNNLKNSGVVNNATKVNQLPISAVVATAKAAAAVVSNNDLSKFVDENKILEQQKQIMELQKALKISQQQLQQLAQQKDAKNGGPQKHRLVLQQHIQHKLQQQAIQNQLQNLIQLQTQQAEQKKQLLQKQQTQLVLISSGANSNHLSQAMPTTVVSPMNNLVAVSASPVTILTQSHPVQDHAKLDNTQEENSQHQSNISSLDHSNSWVQENVGDVGKSLNFEDLVQTMDPKDIPKLEPTANDAKDRSHQGVKSQMVDDVLEILIRNGELPPSAAQDPQGKSVSSSAATGSNTNENNDRGTNSNAVVPPPPPPLPPPSFSVMLPTTIPFSRHHNLNGSEFVSSGTFGRKDENSSKDAQEILRICEDLSNFGKTREAEAAAASRLERLKQEELQHPSFQIGEGNNASTMDCSFFTDSKDFDLSDSMDVGFDDTHSVSMHSTSSSHSKSHNDFHKHPFHNSVQSTFGVMMNGTDKTNNFDNSFSFNNSSQHQNGNLSSKSQGDISNHHFMSDDDLLPVSLDMQMDTDYSDWLDTLLPVSDSSTCNAGLGNNISAPAVNTLYHAPVADVASKNNSEKHQTADGYNKNVSAITGNSNRLFGSLLDEHQHHTVNAHQQQRDPLLSSRSFSRITLPFGGDQLQSLHQNNFLLAHLPNPNSCNATLFHNSPTSGSSSATTLMDTDFDELAPSLSKKSEINNATEMPSTTAPPSTVITTNSVSINDNFLWDFAM